MSTDLYWTFEELGTANRVDKVQGVVLGNTSSGVGNEYLGNGAGIIGNALKCFNGAPGGSSSAGVSTSPLSNPKVVQLGTGFSWIGWFNVVADAGFGAQANWFVLFGGPAFPYRMTLALKSSGVIEAVVTDGVNTDFLDWGSNFVPGTWTFFHIWFDPADNKFRLDINNSGVPIVSPDTFTILSTAGQNGQTFCQVPSELGTGFNASYDEFGFKLNRILTPAERAFLFNAGAGQTWPAVNTIFS